MGQTTRSNIFISYAFVLAYLSSQCLPEFLLYRASSTKRGPFICSCGSVVCSVSGSGFIAGFSSGLFLARCLVCLFGIIIDFYMDGNVSLLLFTLLKK